MTPEHQQQVLDNLRLIKEAVDKVEKQIQPEPPEVGEDYELISEATPIQIGDMFLGADGKEWFYIHIKWEGRSRNDPYLGTPPLVIKRKKKPVDVGYGYYQLPVGERIGADDEEQNKYTGNWARITFAPWEVEATNPNIYRRKIIAPEGYEVYMPDLKSLTMSDNSKVFKNRQWQYVDNISGAEAQTLMFCRPIVVNKYPDGWWKDRVTANTIPYTEWLKDNRKRLRHLQILEDRIAELNEEWDADWDDNEQPKLSFCQQYFYGDGFKEFYIHRRTQLLSNNLHFKSKEIGEQLIKELGEDFIKIALNFV